MNEIVTGTLQEFVTWEFLATFAGAVAFLTVLVQILKLPIDWVTMKLFGKDCKLPTRLVVYIFALVILYTAQGFLGMINWSTGVLTLFNAVLVMVAAMGTYELAFKKIEAAIAAKKAAKDAATKPK
jgi:hypothetical protein